MTTTAAEMRDDNGDWDQAWGYGDGSAYHASANRPTVCEGAACSDAPCGVDSIARVVAASEGENDGPDWVAVALLEDGRFAFVEAGCDYTGWDCQAGGQVWVSDTLENLWRFGLTDDARDRLGHEPPAQWVDA